MDISRHRRPEPTRRRAREGAQTYWGPRVVVAGAAERAQESTKASERSGSPRNRRFRGWMAPGRLGREDARSFGAARLHLAVLILEAVEGVPDGLDTLLEIGDNLGGRLFAKFRVGELCFELRQIVLEPLLLSLPPRVARTGGKCDASGHDGERRALGLENIDQVNMGKPCREASDGLAAGTVEMQLASARWRTGGLAMSPHLLDDGHHGLEFLLRSGIDE